MPYDEALASRVREILSLVRGFSDKKMFGGLCFLINGNMCCGVLNDELVLRLEPEHAEDLLSRPHTRPMDFTGRPMQGYVYVAPEGLETDAALEGWVSRAIAYATQLPAKGPRRTPTRS